MDDGNPRMKFSTHLNITDAKMAEEDLLKPNRQLEEVTPRVIAKYHIARETLNLFAGRKARILLAEDNLFNQQVALVILEQLGLAADVVTNGKEALKALESIPYDLVLMDV